MPASCGLFSLPKSHRFHCPPGHMTPLYTAGAHQGQIRGYSSAAGDPHTNTDTSTRPSSLPFLFIRGCPHIHVVGVWLPCLPGRAGFRRAGCVEHGPPGSKGCVEPSPLDGSRGTRVIFSLVARVVTQLILMHKAVSSKTSRSRDVESCNVHL